ncbi:MAG: hypothetical protein COC07_08330 [Erythrobacteraceae bacterium]|nr:MAG: hypothetical protein COC07_08330 [Erythrobacteraceae bacterium]
MAGVVLWPNGTPAVGADVRLAQKDEMMGMEIGRIMGEVQAGPDGSFKFPALGDGTCEVTASCLHPDDRPAPGSKLSRLKARRIPRWMARVEGIAPGTQQLSLTLTSGNVISGKVVDDAGEAVKAFRVTATPEASGFMSAGSMKPVREKFKDKGGEFALQGVQVGRWEVRVTATGYGDSERKKVSIPGAGELRFVVPRTGLATGIVRAPDGSGVGDARVVASRSREERAAYAAIIADFARRPQIAPRPALAAPMACPVLGDKSIIHRLRSLPMTDHSRRRRFAVRGAVAAAVFALPMTASIGYAEGIAAHVPEEPFALQTPVAPLSPPAPEAPDAPQAPEPPSDREFVAAMERTIEREFDRAERDIERAERELERARESMARVERDPARHARWDGRNWDQMSDKEKRAFKKEMAQLREDLADGGKVQRELQQIEARQVDRAESRREVQLALAEAHAEVAQVPAEAVAEKVIASAPKVVMKCLDKDRAVTTKVDAKGRTTMYVCESYGDTVALKALKHTRESLAADRNWSDEMRTEILADIDAEIERLSR